MWLGKQAIKSVPLIEWTKRPGKRQSYKTIFDILSTSAKLLEALQKVESEKEIGNKELILSGRIHQLM